MNALFLVNSSSFRFPVAITVTRSWLSAIRPRYNLPFSDLIYATPATWTWSPERFCWSVSNNHPDILHCCPRFELSAIRTLTRTRLTREPHHVHTWAWLEFNQNLGSQPCPPPPPLNFPTRRRTFHVPCLRDEDQPFIRKSCWTNLLPHCECCRC